MTDPIADLLTRLRNAQTKGKTSVNVPYSKIKHELVKILKEEGYISSFFVSDEEPAKKVINVRIKYYEEKPVMRHMKRISKPGQRIYLPYAKLPRSLGGMGTMVVSTSQGLMTARLARHKKLGGELICEVY